ncbi:recombinase family protein [Actinacidiphila oryziradicis]|uniref:recombinase family protein n=1 Tax=Actinacidiphila oryziradicis TaxID=2571141 RepID=UPI001FECADE4|nr:recombinase family protein [Actinacidiphila oryziradicis]
MQQPPDDDTADLLAPPATGGLVGYARVSTKGQLLDRQIHALTEAGCIRIFADKKSGKNAEREELWKALDFLREGDTLVVPSLDRLGRSIQDLSQLPLAPLCQRPLYGHHRDARTSGRRDRRRGCPYGFGQAVWRWTSVVGGRGGADVCVDPACVGGSDCLVGVPA